jgi:hypothetical protein
MLPKTTIIIGKDGSSRLEGQEKSDQCFKINELARMAGKVESEKPKDHQPVHQDVNNKA